MANFLWKLKAEANCEGGAIFVLPRPAIPVAPSASPFSKKVGAHEKRKRETATFRPGLKPLVDCTETASSASSPVVAVWVTVLSGKTPQVLLLHPGLGDEKQRPQPVDAPAREHWAERHRAGRYVEEM